MVRNGKLDINGMMNLRFRISQEKAFEVIEGSSLYADKYIFIREIIQNAQDATKIQLWRDLKNLKYQAWMDKKWNKKDALKTIMPFEIPVEIFNNYSINVFLRK